MIGLLNADVLRIPLADGVAQCIVTSPPYYGLRDYGVNGQLGLEQSPEEYTTKMVEVFREVKRVLRDDGTLWLNMGDSYAGSGGVGNQRDDANKGNMPHFKNPNSYAICKSKRGKRGSSRWGGGNLPATNGLKPKDLIGIPWRLAFALQADGWVLRSDIVWAKPNPMPESVRDRPTKSHEYLFMFSKARWVGQDKGMFASISDEDARWLALLLDAEGNICAKRAIAKSGQNHYGTQICFANTSKFLIDITQKMIGRGSVAIRKGKNAPMYYLQLTHIQAANLLYRIYPYLIIKKRQAKLAIYLQDLIAESGHERRTKAGFLRGRMRDDSYTDELEKIWIAMKYLNHFGNPDLSYIPEPKYGHWDSQPYFYDADAVREGVTGNAHPQGNGYGNKCAEPGNGIKSNSSFMAAVHNATEEDLPTSRNLRDVWMIATHPYKGSHFATFPPALVEPCIKAGTSRRGCCPKCGKAWERMVEKKFNATSAGRNNITGQEFMEGWAGVPRGNNSISTLGWQPDCSCNAGDPVPCIVFDPFVGSGTTLLVARKLGRHGVGCDLSYSYLHDQARKRLELDKLKKWTGVRAFSSLVGKED